MNSINKKIIVLSLFGLLLGSSAFAINPDYQRIPSDYTITNPVNFEVSHNDVCSIFAEHYYRLQIVDLEGILPIHWTEIVDCSIPTYTFEETLELGTYYQVLFHCVGSEGVSYSAWSVEDINAGLDPIFEVVEGEPELAIIPVDPNLPTDMLGYAGILFTDLGSLIIMAVGVPMGFVVIKKVISLIKT